jgi:F-type H+-transporting ATPase subunit delta
MAEENTTIARPYAEAAFQHAKEVGKLDLWSEMLGFLAEAMRDERLAALVDDPNFGRDNLEALLLDIAGERIHDEGRNFIQLLVRNRRLAVLPGIATLYEFLKREDQGALDVHIDSAYALNPAQQETLEKALGKRLGKEVRITSNKDPSLIGGARIHVGDLVIDGSVRGRLRQLAHEFGI